VTGAQIYVIAVLCCTLGLFVWGRWRYDVVALMALMAVLLGGIVPPDQAFVGFGHPAVITVAAVLVISRALQHSDAIAWIVRRVTEARLGPSLQVGVIAGLVAALSGFMNNVGALALMMPVVLQIGRKADRAPRELLMPLSFGSLLGGLVTMIGTPPNIIVATVRADFAPEQFGMFDFTPVGAAIAVIGVLFIAVVGWHLIPAQDGPTRSDRVFEIEDYITEVRIPQNTRLIGKTIREAYELGVSDDIVFVSIHRGERKRFAPPLDAVLRSGDHLLIEGDAHSIDETIKATGMVLVGSRALHSQVLQSETIGMMEAVVTPASALVRRTAGQVGLAVRHHMNLIAIARHGVPVRRRLNQVRFQPGDVLLLQGDTETMPDALAEIGCLPLAERRLALHQARSTVPIVIFLAAILASAFGLLTAPVAFVGAVALLLASGHVSLRDAYDSVDWPVLVLLGAMIPVGQALELSGGSLLIANAIASTGGYLPPWALLAIVLVAAMMLSDVMNNAATAVLMAPLAGRLAQQLGLSPDPFLMAVAIGASCAFLTPIGHQSNVIVMGPGGYQFGDYWRMGLPLEVIICAIAVPTIMWVWPM